MLAGRGEVAGVEPERGLGAAAVAPGLPGGRLEHGLAGVGALGDRLRHLLGGGRGPARDSLSR
ncbi:hypothetical protein GCM10010106_06780 [Thermopolyspora flexuosa]|nr:hypothetical protein GCM10010106_06780 [Thermopolyspora flexuosa]